MHLYRGTLLSYLCDNYEGEIIRGDNGSHPALYFTDKKSFAVEYAMKMAYQRRNHETHPVVIGVEAPEERIFDIHHDSEELKKLEEKAYEGKEQIFRRQTVEDKFTVPHLFTKYIRTMALLNTDADSLEEAYETGGHIVIEGSQDKLETIFQNMLG